MTEGVTGLLVYIALKLFGYSGWSWAGLAWLGNGGRVESEPLPWDGQSHSVSLTLPPLATLILVPEWLAAGR